jgi:hypothetical protein
MSWGSEFSLESYAEPQEYLNSITVSGRAAAGYSIQTVTLFKPRSSQSIGRAAQPPEENGVTGYSMAFKPETITAVIPEGESAIIHSRSSLMQLFPTMEELPEIKSFLEANSIGTDEIYFRVMSADRKYDDKIADFVSAAKPGAALRQAVAFDLSVCRLSNYKLLNVVSDFGGLIMLGIGVTEEEYANAARLGLFFCDRNTGELVPVPFHLAALNDGLFFEFFGMSAGTYVLLEIGQSYNDVKDSHWAQGYISQASEKGLVQGVGDGRFSPESSLTRAQFAQMLYNYFRFMIPASDTAGNFDDVTQGQWYYDAILTLQAAGVFEGGGNFRPADAITREEMAGFIYGAINALLLSEGMSRTDASVVFADFDGIAPELRSAVELVYATGIMVGVQPDMFAPDETTTRAQAATVIVRLAKLTGYLFKTAADIITAAD